MDLTVCYYPVTCAFKCGLSGSNPVAVTQTLDMVPVSSEEFYDIQVIIECRFTLKRVGNMIIT